jgi:trehalose 6-phosphate phosphatase
VKPPIASDAALGILAALDLGSTALLFDVDGTLIDIGPSPFEVDVSDELKDSLRQLYHETNGALALVSGRPIRDLDLLFKPLVLPAIGGHGAETRTTKGTAISKVENLPEALRKQLVSAAIPGSGIEVEDKGYSVALHYRKAPKQAEALRRHVAVARAAFPGEPTELLLGKAMFEVKRPGINKGDAIRVLMEHLPFAGRTPVFFGDDVTDESAFKVLPEFGGKGFGVGRGFPGMAGIFASPSDVRRALQRLAARVAELRA